MASDPSDFSVTIDCSASNGYTAENLRARISSVFVILVGSLLGALLPIYMARTRRIHVPPLIFFFTKYFGSGVIIATAFIHLLAPANSALQSPCLDGPITDYPWAEGIALMTAFVMFFLELMAFRYQVFGQHGHHLEASDPSADLFQQSAAIETPEYTDFQEKSSGKGHSSTELPSSGADAIQRSTGQQNSAVATEAGKAHGHDEGMDSFAAEMTAIFILEFGVVFHSIFIGLTLAVAGDEFTILYIVLVFHQSFEGLGIGSRLATAQWPRSKRWLPWVLGTIYGITTPVAIAAGLGVNQTLLPGSSQTLIVNGVFDSISSGILLYTGFVELMAHDFLFNHQMHKSSIGVLLSAVTCMCLGAGLMALLGKWA